MTRPQERPLLFQLLLLSFLFGGGAVFADAAANAQFVSTVGGAQMPISYIIAALMMSVVGFLYTRSQRYLPLRWLIGGTALILTLGTIAVWVGLATRSNSPVVYAGIVWYLHINLFGQLAFWTAAGALLSMSQSKRLFGVISTGQAAAQITAYLTVPLVVRLIGNVNMFLLSAVLLGCAGLVVFRLLRRAKPIEPAHNTSDTPEKKPPRRYVWLIYTIIGLPAIGFYLIGLNYYTQSGLQIESAESLATLYGIVAGASSLAVLGFNTLFSAALLQRLGLIRVLFIRPIANLIVAVPLLLIGSAAAPALLFGLAVTLRLSDTVLYGTAHKPASALLYQPLAASTRVRVRGEAEGIVISLAIGIAGALLLILGPERVGFNMVLIILVMAALLGALVLLARAYPTTLQLALNKRVLADVPFGMLLAPPVTANDPLTTQLEQILDQMTHVLSAYAAIERPLVRRALAANIVGLEERLFELLSGRYPPHVLRQIRDNLGVPDRHDYAVELAETLFSAEHRRLVMPLLRSAERDEQLESLARIYSPPQRDELTWLGWLVSADPLAPFTTWVRTTAAYTSLTDADLQGAIDVPKNHHAALAAVEKVLTLRHVSLFETTPDHAVARVAALLTDVTLESGETIIEKGERGESMYIIVTGRVRVHDDGHTLNYLGEREVFGEMALLDPHPRAASVSAETPTHLFQLHQQPLFELMEIRPEVARGIIRVLSRHLRDRMADLNALRADRLPNDR